MPPTKAASQVFRAVPVTTMERSSTLAASVTGIAGPGGGSQDKPVGLVHFSCQWRGKPAVHDHQTFTGDRDSVRKKSLHKSLTMIYNELK